ncbi:MAG: nitroreductase family protein [Desulfovibrio sp.]|nr:nitroreductase family protein [Desulfovibrio sp.]
MNDRRQFLYRSIYATLAALGLWSLPAGKAEAVAGDDWPVKKVGESLALPSVDAQSGMPLMQALAHRKSHRNFLDEDLPVGVVGDIVWAAWGVNRKDGRRTAPTARNEQQVSVYAAMRNGVWRYVGENHSLVKELERDTRSDFGGAPLTLAYAAEIGPYGAMHLGALYQNVGLYCASTGLANVVKATGVDVLKNDLALPKGYQIMIVQSVGRAG